MTLKQPSVAIIYDLDDWILGTIAREMVANLHDKTGFHLVAIKGPKTRRDWQRVQEEHQILHFLSPWIFLENRKFIYRSTVVTVHHIGSIAHELLSTLDLDINALCTTNHQCREMLQSIPKLIGKPITLTPYALNTNFFVPKNYGREALLKRLNFPSPSELKLIGLSAKTSSNEDNRKGFDRYWELLRRLRAQVDSLSIRLVIFGPDSQQPGGWSDTHIPDDVRGLVSILGFVDAEELPTLYCGLDFYICLSRLEGGPYPVMECLACGVPVISTEVGIVKGLIIDGQTGFLVTEENYLDRIPTLLGDQSSLENLRQQARNQVIKLHSYEAAYKPFLYNQLYTGVGKFPSLRVKLRNLLRYLSCKFQPFKLN